jgi:predicted ATPase
VASAGISLNKDIKHLFDLACRSWAKHTAEIISGQNSETYYISSRNRRVRLTWSKRMLTELSFRNFKSWKEIDRMRMAPVTGLFGTNSSGKSSIIQFLLLLKQTAEANDRRIILDFGDENSKINLGNFKEIIHGHDESSPLDFSVSWKLPKPLFPYDSYRQEKLVGGETMKFETAIIQEKQKLKVEHFKYTLGRSESFGMEKNEEEPNKYKLFSVSDRFQFIRKQGRAWRLPAPIKFYGFPDEVNTYFQNADFISDLQLELTQMLGRLYYLGPLREYPKRHYTSKGTTPSDMGPKGEYVVDAILAARQRGAYISPGPKKRRRTLEESVAFWLKELGLIHSFKVEPIAKGSNLYQVKVKRGPQSSEVLITDVGFGVSQILPVLVMCYYVDEGSTILLEQPEIHLHPSVQMGLADVFIDVMKHRNVQVILESHSEHLLNRLQRRLAEESISTEQVALYFCDAGQAASRLNPLQVDLYGNIENWPPDFFGNSFNEIAARQEAQLKRKTGN